MNKSGIKPAGHRILVKPENVEVEKKVGRIHVPIEAQDTKEQVQHAAEKGEVVAVGKEAWSLDTHQGAWAKVGDQIAFARYGGKVMEGKDGEHYRLMNDEDILAVLHD